MVGDGTTDITAMWIAMMRHSERLREVSNLVIEAGKELEADGVVCGHLDKAIELLLGYDSK